MPNNGSDFKFLERKREKVLNYIRDEIKILIIFYVVFYYLD
jgi:hypothetical protein